MTHDDDELDRLGPVVEPSEDETSKPRSQPIRWIVAIGAVALLIGVWLVSSRLPGWLTQPEDPAASSDGSAVTGGAEARRIQATLFYVAPDGLSLVPTSRTVPYAPAPADQARRLVEAQVAEAPEGLVSAIPSGTTVLAVFLTDTQEAYVDLGGAIVSGHSGGALDEALTVYTIVNALTANLPEVTRVQILIDGREVDSLRGHLDLREPLARSTDWIQKGPDTQ